MYGHSCCSICHNRASSATQFCSHIKNGKNRKFSGKVECQYHKSECKPTDDCPVCKKTKTAEAYLDHKDTKVFEWNYDIKFIEDSFVVNPACHDCLVCDILNVPSIQEKFSNTVKEVKKVASAISSSVGNLEEESLVKVAGKQEVEALNQCMNLMEHVARSMMAQKQQIQLEYVSDLVENLAKLQGYTDELIEMGYAQLPSPTPELIANGSMAAASPLSSRSNATII